MDRKSPIPIPAEPRDRHLARRSFLERTLQFSTAGTVAATAGCTDLLGSPEVVRVSAPIIPAREALSESEFDEYVASIVDVYGNRGVWGTSRTEVEHGLSFVGAWTTRSALPQDVDPDGDPSAARVLIDGALALYRIPGKVDENDNEHYQCWLWCGGRVPDGSEDDFLGRGPRIETITAGVDATSPTATMLAYSPDAEVRDRPLTIDLPSPDSGGPVVELPLDRGTVNPVADATRVGDGGEFGVIWQGTTNRLQAICGTCELRWPPSEQFDLRWTIELTGR